MSSLSDSLLEAALGRYTSFSYAPEFTAELQAIWSPQPAVPASQPSAPEAVDAFSEDISYYIDFVDDTQTSWSIAFTPTFRKSVSAVDKKLQGRVLTAITELSEAPVTAQGDTVKPLVGERKGLWRYRIGDYRLVYEPK